LENIGEHVSLHFCEGSGKKSSQTNKVKDEKEARKKSYFQNHTPALCPGLDVKLHPVIMVSPKIQGGQKKTSSIFPHPPHCSQAF